MLVLTRRADQSIHIGRAIVTVLGIKGRYVRLGIDASPDVHIVRSEIRTDTARGAGGDGAVEPKQ